MRLLRSILFLLIPVLTNAQTITKIEGQTYTNTADTWPGVNISRTVPTALTFKNNLITSSNRYGYMLQAGDEKAGSTNNNLDKAVITGNKFVWKGSDMTVITHGLFTGHNKDVTVKYNYLDHVPMAIIRKSTTNMSNTSGGVAYNIVKGGAVAIVIKGMSNVNIYNNTLYSDRTTSETWRPLINIYTNVDATPHSLSHGTKIYNNIMYTKYQTFAISVDDAESLTGLKCDYNVYWCETGSPRFSVAGVTKTFAQWQAMGFDTHSKVVNPNFKDFISFVPTARLDFGTNLGTEWQTGLSVNPVWGKTDPATVNQNGTWQVGAVIYAGTVSNVPIIPVYVSAAISNDKPSILEATYNTSLANIIPAASAFIVNVNSVARSVSSVSVSDKKVILTLVSPVVYGDVVTFAYTKPSANAIVTLSGGQAATLSSQPVQNNILNNPVAESPQYVSSVIENSSPARLELSYNMVLANVIPEASAFTVNVNSVARPVSSVSVSDTKVNLTLANPVVYGDVVTFTYIKPTTNALASPSGGLSESISSQPVQNNVQIIPVVEEPVVEEPVVEEPVVEEPVVEKPIYISSVIENSSPTILELTYNIALANFIPSGSAFTVTVSGIVIPVLSVSVNGSKVILNMANAVLQNDVVSISYTQPVINQLQSPSGGLAENLIAQAVINNTVIPDFPTGENDIIISVYPNPATDYISIKNLKPSVGNRMMRIFDHSGKIFIEFRLDSWNYQTIPIDLEAGLYFVEITSGRIIEHVQPLVII